MNAKEQRTPKLRVLESLRLDLDNQCLWRGNRRVALRPKDYAVLRCLVDHAEQLVTKDALLEAVWPGIVVTEAVLKACISRVRQALNDEAKVPRYIETVHRLGYRLMTPIATTTLPTLGLGARDLGLVSPPPPSGQASSLRSLASPLVGREAELQQLHKWLDTAQSGQRQLVFVTGEPGIGKTTLIEAFRQRLEAGDWRLVSSPQVPSLKPLASPVSFAHGQCINQYGTGDAYLPVLEAFERLCRPAGAEAIYRKDYTICALTKVFPKP
ncbi:MAG: hypothetical protein FJ147_27375 [Deltaproteobacteria bacterium]|nr:hypothetical protein [Deltaproteobacteria bacterium]